MGTNFYITFAVEDRASYDVFLSFFFHGQIDDMKGQVQIIRRDMCELTELREDMKSAMVELESLRPSQYVLMRREQIMFELHQQEKQAMNEEIQALNRNNEALLEEKVKNQKEITSLKDKLGVQTKKNTALDRKYNLLVNEYDKTVSLLEPIFNERCNPKT